VRYGRAMNVRGTDDPVLASARAELAALLTGDLARHAGLDLTIAELITDAVLSHEESQARDRAASEKDHYLSPTTTVLNSWRYAASAAITCARATERCPRGTTWWMDDGIPVLAFLIEGEAVSARIEQAEILAGPYDRSVDFNWPGSIVAERLQDLVPGTSFVAGDGEGNRARYHVVEQEGRLVAEMQEDSWINQTDDIERIAYEELTAILGLDAAIVGDCARWFQVHGFTLILEPDDGGWSTRVLTGSGKPVAVSHRARQRWLAAELTAKVFPWRDERDEG
jgi:hypothetical protein